MKNIFTTGFCVAVLFVTTIGAGSTDPWNTSELVEPATLAKQIGQVKSPTVLFVGFPVLYRSQHILRAIDAGAGSTPEGLARLKTFAAGLPKDADLVIYCGCCPMVKCPNVRPAYRALKDKSTFDKSDWGLVGRTSRRPKMMAVSNVGISRA